MLKKNQIYKLFFLRTLLCLIIFLILGLTLNRGIRIYQSLSLLSKNELSTWLNNHVAENWTVAIDHVKIKWKNFNFYLKIYNTKIKSEHLVQNGINTEINIGSIQGKINILKIILAGKIRINNFIAKQIHITTNKIYKQQTIDAIAGKIKINFSNSLTNTAHIIGDFKTLDMNFTINAALQIKGNICTIKKFKINLYESTARLLIKYLPENLIGYDLLLWLHHSISSGVIKTANFSFGQHKEDLSLQIHFKNIDLKYAKDWPLIENLDAELKLLNNNLEIVMLNSEEHPTTILKQPISKLIAKISGVTLDQNSPLKIYGQLDSSAKRLIESLQAIKTLKNLGHNLQVFSLQGETKLTLLLSIPLGISALQEPITYSGNIKIKEGSFKYLNISGENMLTNIKFSDHDIFTEKFEAKILNNPINIDFRLDQHQISFESNLINFKSYLSENTKKNFLLHNVLDLEIQELSLFNQNLPNVRFFSNKDTTNVYFSSPQIVGTLGYQKFLPNKYLINLEKLFINTKDLKGFNNNLKTLLYFLAGSDFNAKDVRVNDVCLGTISFKSNQFQDKNNFGNNIEISELQMKLPHIDVNTSIKIKVASPSNMVKFLLEGNLSSTNFGTGIMELNLNSQLITNGKGNINFNIEFPINSLEQKLDNFIANLKLQITSGFILGFDPGIGRILGLLNIENIPRRLNLDFSDLTNKGFSFDSLQGDLKLNQKKLQLEHIIIKGPSANIILNGDLFIDPQQLDLVAAVTQKTGATLPLAAAVAAGNPVVGAAVWLFDYASGAKFSEIKMKKFRIQGDWHNPKIENYSP